MTMTDTADKQLVGVFFLTSIIYADAFVAVALMSAMLWHRLRSQPPASTGALTREYVFNVLTTIACLTAVNYASPRLCRTFALTMLAGLHDKLIENDHTVS